MPSNASDISFLIKDISDCIEHSANNSLKRFDITMTQLRVLEYLRTRGARRTSQKDIEAHLQVAHPTVVGILKRLQTKGLVRCWLDEDDKRIKNVALTEREEEFFREVGDARRESEAALTNGLTEPQLSALRRILNQIHRNAQN